MVLAIAGPLAAALLGWGRLDPIAFAGVVLVPTPLLLAVVAIARIALGRQPLAVPAREWSIRFRFALGSALFGLWLLAAILVGLATSGGVVWF